MTMTIVSFELSLVSTSRKEGWVQALLLTAAEICALF